MTHTSTPDQGMPFEPRRPLLTATGLLALWIVILSLPMLAGKFLANPHNDQLIAGYAFRAWGAQQWRALGHVPLWNPEILGGLPFVGAMHGDIFYPTAWFRLFLPTALVMNLEFPVHYLLAGLFVYGLLRRLKTTWSGAVVGGLAYQLSGVIISYAAPGHDGKLFVTTLLPLVLIGLVMGMRERRYEGYAIVAIGVGLALVSPQAQCTYYMLVASGLFALYLAFGERDDRTRAERWSALGLALVAVLVGFGIGMIQIYPFIKYTPFSPRGGGASHGYAWATSYAIPWVHVPGLVLSRFVGSTEAGTYWGPNPIKLHSEYLGLPVIALALLGLRDPKRRRLIYWIGGIGLLFLLVGLGSDTPLYRLWWAVMPYMKKVRAPGIALYVVALSLAFLAAFGVERLERGEGRKSGTTWLIVGLIVAVLGAIGVFGAIATSLARGVASPIAVQAAEAAQEGIRFGALASGVALALAGLLVMGLERQRISLRMFAIVLPLLVGADLWMSGRHFWLYEPAPTSSVYAPDQVTNLLRSPSQTTAEDRYPGRVLDGGGYGGSILMAFDIPELLGYHGNEMHRFDKLLDHDNSYRNYQSPRIRDLFAVRYLILPTSENVPDSLPGFRRLLSNVQTSAGATVNLLEADPVPPYARLVPAAFKWRLQAGLSPDSAADLAVDEQVMTIVNPRSKFDADRLVLLDPDAPVEPTPVDTLPPPLAAKVHVTAWGPEHMTLAIDPPAPQDAYVLVGENYYPMWHATVDGTPTQVLRGDVSLITVPVKAGAKLVELSYSREWFRTGKDITLAALALALIGLVVPVVLRRRSG
ncbi:MAG TPA: hypothetical protein VJ992_08580 [Gemmatimonadales bacterium]|nr:hypothetical protein [Gemmatimonadales bacterium]